MMKSLVLVQSNTGQGHISRAKALGEYLTDRLIITRPFTGKSKSIDFFGKDKEDSRMTLVFFCNGVYK